MPRCGQAHRLELELEAAVPSVGESSERYNNYDSIAHTAGNTPKSGPWEGEKANSTSCRYKQHTTPARQLNRK
eukprot:scaffold21407_cov112-Isochrysis_galbana.AAC.3